MFQRLNQRGGHYLLLITVAAALYLPCLGRPSLWDIDEGNNAEAAREMLRADNWRVPTFNYHLRVDKPALLYWLQILAYQAFGVGEFAARLPSALAALLTVLATYELGRLLYGPAAGLLSGLILASAVMFCAAGHFANPDALLTACTTLAFLCFARGLAVGRPGFVGAGVMCGLAVLAKGPVGVALPLGVTALYLAWVRQLRHLGSLRSLAGTVAFLLVAVPWYVWVGLETRGEFLRGFFLRHNLERFTAPMEGHSGSALYYVVVFILGFLPWSVFLGPACWYAFQGTRDDKDRNSSNLSPGRLLACWAGVYVVFFSFSHTKLPNYILPMYPAVALLTGNLLAAWQSGRVELPRWVLHVCLACLAVAGIGVTVGLAVAGGAIVVPALRGRSLPGLEALAALGLVPFLGATLAWWAARRGHRTGAVVSVTAASLLFVGSLAAWGGVVVDRYKAPRLLAEVIRRQDTDPEVRIACYSYTQPSLVFYCRREVPALADEKQALEFLRTPLPVFLVLPAPRWEQMADRARGAWRLLGRHRDLYRNSDIVVIANGLGGQPAPQP